jgi:glutamyl-tRNA synthetase
MSVVTRFAPSPTGYLHIGGARTALFNWLFARNRGGRYLLRIEDTDRERSTEAAVAAILDGLSWLGLDADEPPIFQFQRAKRHAEAAHALVERGGGYRCYLDPGEADALRNDAKAQGKPFRSPWRDGGHAPAGKPFVVRLRAPDSGETMIDDKVQGIVRIANAEIDDLVLLRSDGTPTYMLAVVIDDHDMGVTHVIRGDDHLTNAFRQLQIIRGLGFSEPVYAHVPMIHGPDGAKLSKRHGALGVDAYRDMGYLPEAMRNYLLRLGWSHGDDEIISTEQAIEWFDLDHIGRSPARLDFDRMASLNAHYLRLADDSRLADLCLAQIAKRGWTPDTAEVVRVRAAMPVLKLRAKTIEELADEAAFLIANARKSAQDSVTQPALNAEEHARLSRLAETLAQTPAWEADALNERLKAFANAEGVGLGKIGPALRVALTGGAKSPDLANLLKLLGKDEALIRLRGRLAAAAG